MTIDLETYYRRIDPTYGSQKHQRDFLARMAECQSLQPCEKDHGDEKIPTHQPSCYSVDTVKRAYEKVHGGES